MELRLIIMALICLCIAQLAFATEELFPFSSQQEQTRFVNLSKQFRCTVCKNQTLFDSSSPIALDMREQIYNSIHDGLTDNEIGQLLVKQHGQYIVFTPPLKYSTGILWFGPVLMFGIAGVLTFRYFKYDARQLAC